MKSIIKTVSARSESGGRTADDEAKMRNRKSENLHIKLFGRNLTGMKPIIGNGLERHSTNYEMKERMKEIISTKKKPHRKAIFYVVFVEVIKE